MKLTPHRLALALALIVALPACSVESPTATDEEALAASSLVGKYHFVWEGARRAEVYRALESKLSGADLEQAKREADAEAKASWIELAEDGTFHSWIGDEEIATAKYSIEAEDSDGVTLGMNGRSVRVRVEEDRITILDPDKGELVFRRQR